MTEVKKADSFERKKQKYFTRLGFSVREAFKLHKDAGLWDRVEGSSKRDWGNVSEHCLVEVARAGVLADMLGLSEKAKRDLKIAAAMHDFFKKGEKEVATAGGLNWKSFEKASEDATRVMQDSGVSPAVVRLVNSVGHGSLKETERVLEKPELGDDDLAFLVMHYVDDYTVGSKWVGEGDILDERMAANTSNERYTVLNEEGMEHFNGETAYEAQGRIGHAVQERLTQEIFTRSGISIPPLELPMFVDNRIRKDIEVTT